MDTSKTQENNSPPYHERLQQLNNLEKFVDQEGTNSDFVMLGEPQSRKMQEQVEGFQHSALTEAQFRRSCNSSQNERGKPLQSQSLVEFNFGQALKQGQKQEDESVVTPAARHTKQRIKSTFKNSLSNSLNHEIMSSANNTTAAGLPEGRAYEEITNVKKRFNLRHLVSSKTVSKTQGSFYKQRP